MNNSPQLYESRVCRVEAIQLLPGNFKDVEDWININGGKAKNAESIDYLRVRTENGDSDAVSGNYIVKLAQGSFQICGSEIFERSYLPVEEVTYTPIEQRTNVEPALNAWKDDDGKLWFSPKEVQKLRDYYSSKRG